MIVREQSPGLFLQRLFAAQRSALDQSGAPSSTARRKALLTLERMVKRHANALAAAIGADFGRRSVHETQLLEIFPIVESARSARRQLARWMAPQPEPVAPYFWPARARVVRQPLGVVGIIVPWNYPLLLALGPLVAALAAGNRAMIKMSELTPRTAELLARIVGSEFAADEVCVVSGGSATGKAFAALPFDHLLFTGSNSTGRDVMQAAAANLTPVTLELGGKSPAIVGLDAPLARTAARIMAGKCRNAGQTCIAPDYVLLPHDRLDDFIAAARAVVVRRYPALASNADYTSIINAEHFERLTDLLADAAAKGATVVPLYAGMVRTQRDARIMPPVAVSNVAADMRIMHEEIFGPILPLLPYRTLDEAIAIVNARPHPLALYYFGTNRADIAAVRARTTSGGMCINDVMLQFAHDALPFGGVGPSGMGAYHGRAGFETFSHRKAVFEQGPQAGSDLLHPPYGRRFGALLRLLQR